MLLDLKAIQETPGGALPFSYALDLSGLELYGEYPFQTPVTVCGTLTNHAGAFEFHAQADIIAETVCARCAKPLSIVKKFQIEQLLAENLQNKENDEILLIENGLVDTDMLVEQAIILDMDRIYLCSPDCKGLCPRCGADLNLGVCGCTEKEPDERLAILKNMLENGQP